MLKRQEPIPFYRNVKILGWIAQITFLIAVIIVTAILVNNVRNGLETLNVRTGFNFLDDPAGFDISESPIAYDKDRTFGYALLVGVLNTLKVSLLGVVLATILGIIAALMRLSKNWLLRNISTVYIETFRNTPLVVQIFLWFTVLLIPSLPSGVNAYNIFGAAYVNNSSGFVIPWLYASNNFSAWLPWLIAAVVVWILFYFVQSYILQRLEQLPSMWNSPWLLGLLSFVLVAGFGYWQTMQSSSHPQDLALEYNDKRGRLTAFHDSNGNGKADRDEIGISAVPVRLNVAEGQLDTLPAKRTDQRQERRSSFGFPILNKGEYQSAEVTFANPELAATHSIHYTNFPSLGIVYQDRNGNGSFDAGEELDRAGKGFEGKDFRLLMTVQNFNRRIVTGQNGEARIPRFVVPLEKIKNAEVSFENPEAFAKYEAPTAYQVYFDTFEEEWQIYRNINENTQFEDIARLAKDSPVDYADFNLVFPLEGFETQVLEAKKGVIRYRSLGAAAEEPELLPSSPLVLSMPSFFTDKSSMNGGAILTVPYLALLLALVFYTASFIAEIVRGGILAVPKGQNEAASALGLSAGQRFRLIVFPQAFRIIIPPTLSQYLNLIKNSSLGVFCSYPDFFLVSQTVNNQSGASMPIILLLIGGYLLISLIFSLLLNLYNARVQLIER